MRQLGFMKWGMLVGLAVFLVPMRGALAGQEPVAQAAVGKGKAPFVQKKSKPAGKGRDYKVVFRFGLMAMPIGNLIFEVDAPGMVAGVAIQSGWFEFDLEIGAIPGNGGHKDFPVGFRFGAFGYSLRRRSFRLRHGVLLGVVSTISFQRKVTPYFPLPFPLIEADLVGFQVRLAKNVWLEIDPLNVGFPTLYDATVALRWEI